MPAERSGLTPEAALDASRELLVGINAVMRLGFEKREEISIGEFLRRVHEAPHLAQNSRQLLWRMIELNGGIEFWRRCFRGLDRTGWEFLAITRAAAMGGLMDQLGLLLSGPPGSGKNELVRHLFDGLIEFTKPDGDEGIGPGAVYAIAECPLNENPLHILPARARAELETTLGIRIDGDLCPMCRQRLLDAKAKYGPDYPIEKIFSVRRLFFSRRPPGQGFGFLAFQDPRHQTLEPIFGGPDIQGIARYPASHPGTRSWRSEVFSGNRGMTFVDEAMRGVETQLRPLLWILWERMLRIENYGSVHLDEVIVLATNEPNLRERLADPHARALFDRLVILRMPYTMDVAANEEILGKFLARNEDVRRSRVHLGPLALSVCSWVDVASRKVPASESAAAERMAHHPDDGMQGNPYRWTAKNLEIAVSRLMLNGGTCLTDLTALQALRDAVQRGVRGEFQPQERTQILAYVEKAAEAWRLHAKRFVLRAMYGDEELRVRMQALLDCYLRAARTAAAGEPIGEFDAPVVGMIERRAGFSGAELPERRKGIVGLADRLRDRGEVLGLEHLPDDLRKALEAYCFDERHNDVRRSLLPDAPSDVVERVRIPFLERLGNIAVHGSRRYCPVCAEEMAREVLEVDVQR